MTKKMISIFPLRTFNYRLTCYSYRDFLNRTICANNEANEQRVLKSQHEVKTSNGFLWLVSTEYTDVSQMIADMFRIS